MRIQTWCEGSQYVLHDADVMPKAGPHLFDAGHWRARNLFVGSATGRASVAFVRGGINGEVWALRNYRRGGLVRFLVRQSYWWDGLESTRPWQEFQLTAGLHAHGLPVPRPVAAHVVRSGLLYRGDLITALIEDAVPLADLLVWRELPSAEWQQIGAMIRRFQEAGVRHDDINVRNVLRSPDGRYFLIDFDKASMQPPGDWEGDNLARFHRSLAKFKAALPKFNFLAGDWGALSEGYARDP